MTSGADRPDGCVRVGTWNVQWAKPGLRKAPLLAEVLAAPDCDILAVTEGDAGILPKGGQVIDAGTDWGYPLPKASPGARRSCFGVDGLGRPYSMPCRTHCLAGGWLWA